MGHFERATPGKDGRGSSLPLAWRWVLAVVLGVLCFTTAGEAIESQVVPAATPEPGATPAEPVPRDPEPQVRGVAQIDSIEARLLASRHRPIVMIRQRDAMCEGDGEPYLPVPVDLVFDNPAVRLREISGPDSVRDPVLAVAPTVSDLETDDASTYLDFPGDPRDPGCTYERWYRATMPEHDPTTYARVVESGGTHVVVQYWFFYVFNDYNNNHEGDWETIQVLYEAPDIMAALHSEPIQVAYAQHAGGETAGWDSGKLEREGARPVVYVSQGSHASHFGSDTFLGWGDKGSGFGCDNTLGPLREVEVTVEMMPVPPVEAGLPGVWLDWRGRWGERQDWQYDGPVGPRRTKRWTDPVGWQERLRDDSINVPGSALLGPGPTDIFCGVTRYGSIAMMRMVGQPWYVLAVLAVPVLAVGALAWLSWATVIAALRVYLRYLPAFAAIGLLIIPIGILSGWLYEMVIRYSQIRNLVEVTERTPVSYYLAAMPIASVQQVISLLVVVPAVLEVYRAIERNEPVTVGTMVRGVHQHFAPMLRAIVKPIGKVVLAQLTVIGLPWAIDRSVRWGFVAQTVVLDDVVPEDAPARSAAAVHGRWWRTAATLLVFAVIGVLPGPLLGIILMVSTSTAIRDVNALSSLIYAVLLPLSILGSTVLYRQHQGGALPLPATEPVTASLASDHVPHRAPNA